MNAVLLLLSVLLVASALCLLRLGSDLLSSIVALGVFGLLSSLMFLALRAPDVAIAEAGIGAALTTAIFLLAYRAVAKPRAKQPAKPQTPPAADGKGGEA
jgi:uncharacterized MnhB-related membrane protein